MASIKVGKCLRFVSQAERVLCDFVRKCFSEPEKLFFCSHQIRIAFTFKSFSRRTRDWKRIPFLLTVTRTRAKKSSKRNFNSLFDLIALSRPRSHRFSRDKVLNSPLGRSRAGKKQSQSIGFRVIGTTKARNAKVSCQIGTKRIGKSLPDPEWQGFLLSELHKTAHINTRREKERSERRKNSVTLSVTEESEKISIIKFISTPKASSDNSKIGFHLFSSRSCSCSGGVQERKWGGRKQ